MTHLPISSSVLQRRRGYRDVLRHYLTLRAATMLPLSKTELHRLLGLKDVASLYELWCFFAVVRAVEEVRGRAPDYAERTRSNEVQVDVPRALKVSWGTTIDVIYNLTFSPTGTGAKRSASLLLRPDIVVYVRGSGPDAVHILDAKLRVDDVTNRAAAGMTMKDPDRTFKNSDIVKMHAYRDALPSVRSAFVLYPGFVSRAYPALDGGPRGIDGVGAIALRPGGPRDDLGAHLRRLLPTPGSV